MSLNKSMLRFTRGVSVGLLWLFWLLVGLSIATCVAVASKL